MSMVLLLSMNEADCLDQQHRRASGTTNRHLTGHSAYRAGGSILWPIAVADFTNSCSHQHGRDVTCVSRF